MEATSVQALNIDIDKLNKDIEQFPHVYPITEDMHTTRKGVSRMVMIDRYSYKDTKKETLSEGDLVVLTVKPDPSYPARGIGYVQELDWDKNEAVILLEEEYRGSLEDEEEIETGLITRSLDTIEKPLEIFYEQIVKRNARGLAEAEADPNRIEESFQKFYNQLRNGNFVHAGRVLYGAGSGTDVTYFNCYVMPFVPDSREGISDHRKEVMEIMSRGGGVGTNGSTLRPRNTLARGVNGKSSGSVSWLDDIAQLTHLVEQGGSRRGAQMIMLVDSHPDIIDFIISKMQNPRILRYLIERSNDEQIKQLAKENLKFTPFTAAEAEMYDTIAKHKNSPGQGGFSADIINQDRKSVV